MHKIFFQILLVALLIPIEGKAQVVAELPLSKKDTADSIGTSKKNFFYRPKMVIGVGGHNSFIAGEQVKISGFRGGVEFNGKVKLGWGIYYLNPPIRGQIIGNDGKDTIFYEIKFSYLSRFIDYIILSTRWWELSVPHVTGFGSTTVKMKIGNQKDWIDSLQRKVGLSLIDISLLAYFKPLKWIGLGASVGWRNVYSDDEKDPELSRIVAKTFDGPNWALKVKIYMGELTKSFKKKPKEESEDSKSG